MGSITSYQAVCKKCNSKFPVRAGASDYGIIFHCVRCGKEKKTLRFEFGPNKIFQELEMNQLSYDQYEKVLFSKVKKCKCGGRFIKNDSLRCSKCKSKNITPNDDVICIIQD